MATLEKNMLAVALLPAAATQGSIPTREIAPGVHMPLVGLGTWQYNDSLTETALTAALQLGYTAVDTADVYQNAAGVARALAASGRARDTYFVTSKIPGGLNYSAALAAARGNVKALGLEYVDLMLVHFPASFDPKGPSGPKYRQEGWRALEAFVRAGGARSIGVSHFCERHLRDVLAVATIRPALNQVGMGGNPSTAHDPNPSVGMGGALDLAMAAPALPPDPITLALPTVALPTAALPSPRRSTPWGWEGRLHTVTCRYMPLHAVACRYMPVHAVTGGVPRGDGRGGRERDGLEGLLRGGGHHLHGLLPSLRPLRHDRPHVRRLRGSDRQEVQQDGGAGVCPPRSRRGRGHATAMPPPPT